MLKYNYLCNHFVIIFNTLDLNDGGTVWELYSITIDQMVFLSILSRERRIKCSLDLERTHRREQFSSILKCTINVFKLFSSLSRRDYAHFVEVVRWHCFDILWEHYIIICKQLFFFSTWNLLIIVFLIKTHKRTFLDK